MAPQVSGVLGMTVMMMMRVWMMMMMMMMVMMMVTYKAPQVSCMFSL